MKSKKLTNMVLPLFCIGKIEDTNIIGIIFRILVKKLYPHLPRHFYLCKLKAVNPLLQVLLIENFFYQTLLPVVSA